MALKDTDIYELIQGFHTTQAIYAAVRLHLPEALADGSQKLETLARTTSCDSALLKRLLRFLVAMDIVTEPEADTFVLASKGEALLPNSPQSLASFAIRSGEELYQGWSKLYEGLVTNTAPFELHFGQSYFEYLHDHPRTAELFQHTMQEHTQRCISAALEAYDFAQHHSLLDVGGGLGQVASAIVEHYPGVKGTVLELPEVIAQTDKTAPSTIQFQIGDFFEHIPMGYDLLILKCIIHDWPDAAARVILKNCRQAMTVDDTMLLIESPISEHTEKAASYRNDLQMFTLFHAKERTLAEYQQLLTDADLRLVKHIPLSHPGLANLSILVVKLLERCVLENGGRLVSHSCR